MNWRKGGMAMNKLWSLPYFRFLWEANKVLVVFLVFAYTALIGLPFAAPSTLTFTGYNPYEKVPFAGGLHNGSILALILCFALPVILSGWCTAELRGYVLCASCKQKADAVYDNCV